MESINKDKYEFLALAKQLCPGFVIDEYNRQVVADLFSYFSEQSEGVLDKRKGIWLEGPIGVGKTTLLYVFSVFLRAHGRNSYVLHNATEVTLEYVAGEPLHKYTSGFQCIPSRPVQLAIDEVGREPVPAYRYKTPLNVMQYLLTARYALWQRQGIITHVTTNLDAEDVEIMYGEFIRDRRQEYFNVVPLPGPSRRKPKPKH